MSRIIRSMMYSEWEVLFPRMTLFSLYRPISNHCSILLDCEVVVWGHEPFHFEKKMVQRPFFSTTTKTMVGRFGDGEKGRLCDTEEVKWDEREA